MSREMMDGPEGIPMGPEVSLIEGSVTFSFALGSEDVPESWTIEQESD